jgi:hypothetical protein
MLFDAFWIFLGIFYGTKSAPNTKEIQRACFSHSVLSVERNSHLDHRIRLVSRLDYQTSGVLPMALGPEDGPAAQWLQAQFASCQAGVALKCPETKPAWRESSSMSLGHVEGLSEFSILCLLRIAINDDNCGILYT